jgi:glutamine synthetase
MEGDLVERARISGTRFVRFLFCDYSSIVHAKAVGSGSLGRKLTEGVGSTRAQMALNVRDELIDIPQMPPVGEVRLVPDLSTYAELPWAPGSASAPKRTSRGRAPAPNPGRDVPTTPRSARKCMRSPPAAQQRSWVPAKAETSIKR